MRLIVSGEAARNHLLLSPSGSQPLLIKLRADPSDPGSREAIALARAAPGIVPELVAHVTAAELRERAVAARDLAAAAALDLDLGGCLVMACLPGRPPEPPLDDGTIDRVAEVLARLRRGRRRGLPPLRIGERPGAILRAVGDRVAEIRRRRLVDPKTASALGTALHRAEAHLESCWRRGLPPPVSTFCHGDLRWQNFILHRQQVWLIDFEHAGLGDPAVDLAMMVNRTPLSRHDELRLVDAYLARVTDRGFLNRYFAVRPLVALLGAGEAILDLADAHRDHPPMAADPSAYARDRAPYILAEVEDALATCLAPPRPRLRPKLRFERNRRRPPPVDLLVTLDGTAGSLKSEIAPLLARQLGVSYYNTGAAYRYAALWAHAQCLRPGRAADEQRLARHLARARLQLLPDGSLRSGQRRYAHSLYAAAIEASVASWARSARVRAALRPALLASVSGAGAVVEGRGITAELLPDAAIAIFIDAPVDLRARWLADRSGTTLKRAERALARRDRLDATRPVAPLAATPGAWRVDASGGDPERLARQLAVRIRRRR